MSSCLTCNHKTLVESLPALQSSMDRHTRSLQGSHLQSHACTALHCTLKIDALAPELVALRQEAPPRAAAQKGDLDALASTRRLITSSAGSAPRSAPP
jgi:hypothetical protein